MKITIWDILTILTLFVLAGVVVVVLQIMINPYTAINPFKPPTLPPTIAIPTSTATLRALPPTWTPEGFTGEQPAVAGPGVTLAPSSTLPATATGFTLPTFTPTSTVTNTPTNTPTITQTPTVTNTPTRTRTPRPTKTRTPKPPTNTPVTPTDPPPGP